MRKYGYSMHITLLTYYGKVRSEAFPLGLEYKNRTYTHTLTENSGRTIVANGDYTDNFGRFGQILRT